MDFGREKEVFPLVLIQVKSAAKRTVWGLKNKREKTFLPFKTQLFHIQVVRYAASETDDESLRRNEVAMRKAETACRRKLRELKKLPVGSKRLVEAQGGISKKDISLLEWLSRFKEIQRSRGVRDIYSIDRLCGILSDMGCGDTKVRDIGKEFCIVFVEYLKTGYKTAKGENLKPKTAFNRQCTLVTALNVAVREGLIPTNPMNLLSRHERAKASRGKRDYLTIDEVKRLIATPCRNETVKNAYLFACGSAMSAS